MSMDLFADISLDLPFALPDAPGYAVRPFTCHNGANGFELDLPGGQLLYVPRFFSPRLSDRVLEYFQENDTVDWRQARWSEIPPEDFARIVFKHMAWKQDSIQMYGRTSLLPRLTSWYGDPGRSYTYSGITSHPHPWNAGLAHLRDQLQVLAGTSFNSVLLNWYRSGNDHLAWHADDEPSLGPMPVIASANFGCTRDFVLRRNTAHAEKLVVPLSHGSVLVMRGELQRHWQHAVPKRLKVAGSRFNLTFRQIQG